MWCTPSDKPVAVVGLFAEVAETRAEYPQSKLNETANMHSDIVSPVLSENDSKGLHRWGFASTPYRKARRTSGAVHACWRAS